jgi:hypothetical protein
MTAKSCSARSLGQIDYGRFDDVSCRDQRGVDCSKPLRSELAVALLKLGQSSRRVIGAARTTELAGLAVAEYHTNRPERLFRHRGIRTL